jgi:hypothetical protein
MASLPEPPKPGPEAYSQHRHGPSGSYSQGNREGGGGFRPGGPPRGDRDRDRGGRGGGRGGPSRGPRRPR